MKKISITDSEKKFLFIVLAVAILVASYFWGFLKFRDEADAIEASNVQDEARKDELEIKVAKKAETERETEGFKNKIQEIKDKYPSLIPQEKGIYLVQQAQDIVNFDVDAISFMLGNLTQNFTGEDAPTGMYDLLTLKFNCDYDQFKGLVDYIAKFPDRSTIPSINVYIDTNTGGLAGTLSYKMYYLLNSGKPYEEFPPTEIPSGKAGIFYPGEYDPLELLEEELENLNAQ